MSGLFGKLAVKVVKAKWGSILPAILKAAAEGKFGEGIKRAYWAMAGIKTVSGAVVLALGAGLETVCASYPEYAWTCGAGKWLYLIGGILASVGLVDGGTRAPWPSQPSGEAPFASDEKGPSA